LILGTGCGMGVACLHSVGHHDAARLCSVPAIHRPSRPVPRRPRDFLNRPRQLGVRPTSVGLELNCLSVPMTTAAAIDRLVHHSVILEFTVPSYRSASAAPKMGDGAVTQTPMSHADTSSHP
jgi:hypothetical protein